MLVLIVTIVVVYSDILTLYLAHELARYDLGNISLNAVHVMWTKLSFFDMSSCNSFSKLSIQQEFDVILNHLKEIDIVGKVTIKNKLHEIAYPDMTSMDTPMNKVKTKMDTPMNKVKTKRSQKGRANRLVRYTKCDLIF